MNSTKFEQLYKLSYVSPRPTTPLIIDTIGQRLEKAADLYGDREAYVEMSSGTRLTFRSLKSHAESLASSLISIGLKPGDRVGLWAPNCIEWILTQYATALAGLIQVNINPAYKSAELEYSLNKVGCKAIIMSEQFRNQHYVEIFKEICPELATCRPGQLKSIRVPDLKSVIVISDKAYDGCYGFKQMLEGGNLTHREELRSIQKQLQSSDPINIQYTSGTTGFPKGVVLTHHMVLNNALQIGERLEYDRRNTVLCLNLPLFHTFAMVVGSLTTITCGIKTVLASPGFNSDLSLKAIECEKCTDIIGTPTMFVDMINNPNLSRTDLSSVKAGVMGGSTSATQLLHDVINKLNAKNFTCGYGLTETSPVITSCSPHDSLEKRTTTIGRSLEHLEVKVVDSAGKIVGVNEPGELLVRAYSTMVGYWGDRDKTDEAFTIDRFFKTGDIVKMDEQGYFYHLARLKDIVIRGGENIYPKEIEDFLHKHPKIADVYVVGVPDTRMGEELCACVKLVRDQTMTDKELKEFCKDKISHFKIPKYIEFMNDFPMTTTGKIQKNQLRELIIKKLNL